VTFKGIHEQAVFASWRLFPAPEQEALRAILVEQITQADPNAYRAAMRALALFDTRRRLKQIKAPTLVVGGSNDSTVSAVVQSVLARGIPNAQQVIIPGAGHAVSVDHPEEFNRAMIEFLIGDL
jgi:pimeloyl-ACP methyl ester carboxylesterase